MSAALDFQAVNDAVLANSSYLENRLPNAQKEGQELVAGDIQGNPGKSFKLNLSSGKWADFSTGESGGDPVSFVAAQEGISQGEAAKRIADELRLSRPAPLPRKSKELPACPTDGFPTYSYTYFNADGTQAYMVGRWEKAGYRKSIRPGYIDEMDNFHKGLPNGATPIPYNLPAVLESDFVVVVEGENKVSALLALGICATCNTGGAGKWRGEYAAYFKGKAVFVLPDNDNPGKNHAEAVAASLAPVAASVKIVELPGLPDKGDILDWLKMTGNDAERLRALMNDAPFFKPEKKAGLVLLSSDELVTMEIAPRGHTLYPVIPEQGLVMLFAPRGIGKTLLAMSIANTVAGGGALFGGKSGPAWFASKARRVLYIDGEMPLHAMKSRQQAIQSGMPFQIPSGNLKYLNPEMQPDFQMPKLATKAGQDQLDSVLDGIELVVIDNLATLCSNGRENDTDSWLPVQEWILQLRRRGISVLIVHHAGKNGEQRGASAKEDVLDTVIKLKRPDDYMTEDGARFVVELTKARGLCGPEANPFEASIIQDGDALMWITRDIGNQELEAVRELLKEKKTIRQIAKELDLSRSKVGRLVKAINEGG
jgi:hypothetical protein